MRSKLVIANWKMNGSLQFLQEMAGSLIAANESDTGFGAVDKVVVCPPSIYLSGLKEQLGSASIEVGAQNLSEHASGAYTGELSADMLLDLDCKWVLVGHSERRAYFAESSELVAAKASRALAAGLNTVVCIGETLAQRQAGETEALISAQLQPILAIAGIENIASRLVIAYEPVWAIGTGETATPEQAQQVHEFIRGVLGASLSGVPLLYGGSVKPDNAAQLFAEKDIDGGLIGGASLNAKDFTSICRAMPG